MPTLLALDEGVVIIAGLGISLGGVIAVLAYITDLMRVRSREATKREIAAYVAEGTISPADAVRILTAGDDVDIAQHAVDSVARGNDPKVVADMISAAKNERSAGGNSQGVAAS